ncbi:G-protein coupled receptor 35-like [Ornithorhynchus anatinus]|uniref:G-protein coupled receptors family 1 profile domain-containing protein n=1 Tax=Ornithorhynchus anatinus TaxID=9258 RepID=A0A6I8NAG4_ORNAN|nr:G-protein coupled receptor 35-like [Ornithorhynchus anatinus]
MTRQQQRTVNMTFNNSTQGNDSLSEQSRIIFNCMYGMFFILGLLFNGFALWVFGYKMKTLTETRVYMINLAVADVFLLFTFPLVVSRMRILHPLTDDLFCQVTQSIYLINKYMSMCLVTLISVDRYIGIRYPLKARSLRSPQKAAVSCALLWTMVIIIVSIRVNLQIYEGGFCFQTQKEDNSKTVFFSLLMFFIPLVILTFCSIETIRSLRMKKKTDTHEEKIIQKAIYIVSANLIVFIICFLPLHVALLIQFVLNEKRMPNVLRIKKFLPLASCIANANCCLDAVCYYFVVKEFQEMSGIWPLFKFSKTKANTDKDTQYTTISH